MILFASSFNLPEPQLNAMDLNFHFNFLGKKEFGNKFSILTPLLSHQLVVLFLFLPPSHYPLRLLLHQFLIQISIQILSNLILSKFHVVRRAHFMTSLRKALLCLQSNFGQNFSIVQVFNKDVLMDYAIWLFRGLFQCLPPQLALRCF